jgi:hypothetical protein
MAGDSAHTSKSHRAHFGTPMGFWEGLRERVSMNLLPLTREN